jgi:hypothetical protein
MQIISEVFKWFSIIFLALIAVYVLGRMFGLGFSKSWQSISSKGDKKHEKNHQNS